MGSELKVKIATRDDANKIAEFNVTYAKEIEGKELSLEKAQAGVQHVFTGFNNGFYLVAKKEGKVVGVALITREWSDWSNGAYYCIQSIYLLEDEMTKTVEDAIFKKARKIAQQHEEVCGLRLYVPTTDADAIEKYTKLGLQESPYKLFEEEF